MGAGFGPPGDEGSATGTLGYAHGGTGLTSLGTALQVLRTNAGASAMEWATPAGGAAFSDITAGTNTAALVMGTGGTLTTSGTGTIVATGAVTFALAQAAASSGTPTAAYIFTGAAHTGLAIAEAIDENHNGARTVTFGAAGGTISAQRAFLFQGPTYAAAAAMTITTAATVAIAGPAVASTNVTFTKTALSLWVQTGRVAIGTALPAVDGQNLTIAGAGSVGVAIESTDQTSSGVAFYNSSHAICGLIGFAGGQDINLNSYVSGSIIRQTVNGTPIVATRNTSVSIVGAAASSGAAFNTVLNITPGDHANLTASTEVPDFWMLTHTSSWATGALTTQRFNRFDAPTIAFAAASTVTNCATVAISAAPIAGSNATITNAMALWVQAGQTKLDAILNISGIAAGSDNLKITKTNATPAVTYTAHVASTDPQGFIQLNDGSGTVAYIPYYR